jgi:hypothetical protein
MLEIGVFDSCSLDRALRPVETVRRGAKTLNEFLSLERKGPRASEKMSATFEVPVGLCEDEGASFVSAASWCCVRVEWKFRTIVVRGRTAVREGRNGNLLA